VVLEEKSKLQSRNSQKPQNLSNKRAIEKPSSLKNPAKNQKSPEVFEFCQNLKLPQYYEMFLQNGFDEMEVLKEITTQHLNDMKIPPGHQIKIMKALKNDMPRETASSNVPKRTDLVELPMEESEISKNSSQKKDEKPKKMMKNQETQDDLKDGPFRSEENIEKQEKTLKHSNSLKQKSSKNVTFVDKSLTNVGKTCDEGIGTSPVKGSQKLSCWNCFKLFEGEPLIIYEKNFCSEKCRKGFVNLNEITCEKCRRKSLKSQGIFREKAFYCGEQCVPKIEDLYKMWAKELKNEEKEEKDQQNWKKVEEEEIVEVGNRENADLDLISDLKTLGNRNKEPMFLSIKEIEEKYRDFNLKKTG